MFLTAIFARKENGEALLIYSRKKSVSHGFYIDQKMIFKCKGQIIFHIINMEDFKRY